MSSVDPTVWWTLALLLAAPVVVLATSELDERLRQRDSAWRTLVSVLRWTTLPLLAAWVVAVGLFDLPSTRGVVRLLLTALLLSVGVATMTALRLVIAGLKTRSGADALRRIPQLLLVLPRVATVLVIGWVLIDVVWGVDLSAALTALGVGSLVVSFALQDTLSGLASGLLLVGDAPFAPGDWIRYAEESEGRVVDVNWRSTRIESRDGDLVVVPNAVLAGATLINFDRPSRLHRVVVPVQVAYANPPTRAREMLLDAARATPAVLSEPAPAVRIVQIDDPLMGYEVDLWIDDYRLAPRVSSDFGGRVWYASHRHEVPLPSPAYDLYFHDPTAAQGPGPAEVGERLRSSPLLDQLDDDAIARLAGSARPMRFAIGETITSADAGRGDLYVLWEGSAALRATAPDGTARDAGVLGPGDIFGLFERTGGGGQPHVRAVTDCEVVVVEAGVATAVIGRDPALSDAVAQVVDAQHRRVARIVDAAHRPSPVDDGGRPTADATTNGAGTGTAARTRDRS